jgi:NO-binding membrane sensor protein with MHYT domain
MHFIGNLAIVLGDDQPQLQIVYSAGFTVVSFFIPVLIILIAFASVGWNDTMNTTRVVLGGALTGFAVCGMHYLGQAGISNYECLYPIPFVVGAFIIAVAASTTALRVFFLYRLSWDTRWWRRPICAIVLTSAVSGMHWIASVGTQYRLKEWGPSTTGILSRASIVIVVLVLVS